MRRVVRVLNSKFAAAIATIGTLAVPAAEASNPPGNVSQFQVNSRIGYEEEWTEVAISPNGNAMVAWYQGNKIWARVFAHDLTPLGPDFQVNVTAGFNASDFEVAADPISGRFLVVWRATPIGTTANDIHGRLFESDGQPAPNMDEDIVIAASSGREQYPDVTGLAGGGFYVVWHRGVENPDIFGCEVTSAGAPGGGIQYNFVTSGSQNTPTVAETSPGVIMVAWVSNDTTEPADEAQGIRARWFDPINGFVPPFSDARVNSFTSGAQTNPKLVSRGGSWVVVWRSHHSPEDGDNTIRGSLDGSEFQVNSYTPGTQWDPDVAFTDDGGFVVVWESTSSNGTDTSSRSIHGRWFDGFGSPMDLQFQVNSYTSNIQHRPAVAVRPDTGAIFVAWESVGTPGNDVPPPAATIQAGPCIPYGPPIHGYPLCPGRKPPMDEPGRCEVWQGVGSGSASRAGRGGGATPSNAAPGPGLRYLAGGVGNASWALPSGWSSAMGRYWSHEYAQRIVSDSAPTHDHVWMVTGAGTYREFAGLDSGSYAWSSPSDETRELAWTGSGWELTDIDGTVDSFDANGYWTQRTGRNPADVRTATYTGSQLTKVTLPDGRSESYAYWPSGKLQSITEGGVDVDGNGTPDDTRTWTYDWTGDDLTRITRPDGTKWELFYEDAAHPGYMTRMELVGTDSSRRIESAWEYDSSGNVVKIWRGSLLPDSTAVDLWEYLFDDPERPRVTTVVDPVGGTSTFHFGSDPLSRKPRLATVTGSCPSCDIEPDSVFAYDDPLHPLRPTSITDGDGTVTAFTYDSHGRTLTRTEAVGTAIERTTTWTYDLVFPSLVRTVTERSTDPTPMPERYKVTTYDYDAAGNLRTTLQSVWEGGLQKTFKSETHYPASSPTGMPDWIDPDVGPEGPDEYGTADRTTFVYDVPGRNGYLLGSRTDPLVGTTSFSYDPFNRRETVTDANGLVTTTSYDDLDRPLTVSREGGPDPDLVTSYFYYPNGDLRCVEDPEGRGTEFSYDFAGRLYRTVKKADCELSTPPFEELLYELDEAGNRTREKRSKCPGGSCTDLRAETVYEYASRCHLQKTRQAPGTPYESVTEHEYDCSGNLRKTWDANHPRSGNDDWSTLYDYDELDRLVAVTQPWGGPSGSDVVTSYGYDVQDHLVSVVDGEGTETVYFYSDRGLLVQQESEVSGITSHEYNAHGQLVETTDALNNITTYTVDAADRIELVDYAGTETDVDYEYGTNPSAFELGRLVSITRGANPPVEYAYDRFGRLIQDGALDYGYDGNGSRTSVTYHLAPGTTLTTAYTMDDAGRPAALTLSENGGPAQTVLSAAQYEPFGPLASLTFGNGLVESRAFDRRFHPLGIATGTLLDWDYATDGVGNVTSIVETAPGSVTRSFTYQDYQYFLTGAVGPAGWQSTSWTYDRIGNLLNDSGQASLNYVPNSSMSGNTSVLDAIYLGFSDTHDYVFDDAGRQQQISSSAGAWQNNFAFDDESRLVQISKKGGTDPIDFTYDGRGFLSLGVRQVDGLEMRPLYSSEGVYQGVRRTPVTADEELEAVFYLGNRPIAQWRKVGTAPSSLTYLTTDHLGTPILATTQSATHLWSGGFEPYGRDYADANSASIRLRLPGQIEDPLWRNGGPESDWFYNVHRWYQPQSGRYSRPDPLFRFGSSAAEHLYANSNPLNMSDSLGLAVWVHGGLQKYVDCARGNRLFQHAWNWFISNGQWSVQPLDPKVLSTGGTIPLPPRDSGTPNCSEGGRMFPDQLPRGKGDGACLQLVESIAHEVLETWAFCALGLSPGHLGEFGSAHIFVELDAVSESDRGLDDSIAQEVCSGCTCRNLLNR